MRLCHLSHSLLLVPRRLYFSSLGLFRSLSNCDYGVHSALAQDPTETIKVALGAAISIAVVLLVVVNLTRVTMLVTPERVRNAASVKTLGAFVNVTSIQWGVLEPNQTAYEPLLITPTSNVASTFSLATSNYTPAAVANYTTVSWDYNGSVLQPNQGIEVTLSLYIHEDIHDITNFSFDIIIISVEA